MPIFLKKVIFDNIYCFTEK